LHRRCLLSDAVKARLLQPSAPRHSMRHSIQKLQCVQNSAAQIVLQAPRRSHTKPLLRQLHWLPVQHRITYKLAVLEYKVRTTSTPSYVTVCGDSALDHDHSLSEPFAIVQHLPSVHSVVLLRPPGTICQNSYWQQLTRNISVYRLKSFLSSLIRITCRQCL